MREAYLTPEEEAKFGAWLEGKPNPAVELLAALRTMKIDNLADLDQIAKKIQKFNFTVREIISSNNPRLVKLTDKPGIILTEYVAPDDVILLASFCLAQAGVSLVDVQNVEIKYQPYISRENKNFRDTVSLLGIFNYLRENDKLIPFTEGEKMSTETDSAFNVNPNILFFKKFVAPLEDVTGGIHLPISYELMEQLNQLLFLLEQAGDKYLQQNPSPDEFSQKITDEMGNLPLKVNHLIQALVYEHVSKYSASERSILITKFEDNIKTIYPNLSEEVQKTLQNLEEHAHHTVGKFLQKNSIENFSKDLLEPIDKLLENKHLEDMEQPLIQLRTIFHHEINRLFLLGKRTDSIRNTLTASIEKVEDCVGLFLNEKDSLKKSIKEKNLLELIGNERLIFSAKEMLDPFEAALNVPGLLIPPTLKQKLDHLLYVILNDEILSCLKKSESEDRINQRFEPLINELAVLVAVLGNPEVNKDEKLTILRLLKRHVEDQHSVFPSHVVQALRSVIGTALTSFFIKVAESTFFRQSVHINEKLIKDVMKAAETEVVKSGKTPSLGSGGK